MFIWNDTSISSNIYDELNTKDKTFSLFFSKFLTTIAMHLFIFPKFTNALDIMKYVNNHPSRFDYPNTVFWLAFFQCMSNYVFEVMNSMILFSRVNVYFTIVSFVTVTLLADLGSMYYFSIHTDRNNVLFDVFLPQNKPKIVNRRSNMTFT